MIEQIVSIAAAGVVFVAVVLRLNILHPKRDRAHAWLVLEVMGLALLLAGLAGSIGEWFLPNSEFHSETVVLVGCALFALAISRGALCQVVARLQGWDGNERRGVYVRGTRLDASEFMRQRFERQE